MLDVRRKRIPGAGAPLLLISAFSEIPCGVLRASPAQQFQMCRHIWNCHGQMSCLLGRFPRYSGKTRCIVDDSVRPFS